jgi:transmembrane sensor
MEQARINYLIDRYLARELSEAERQELLYLLSLPHHQGLLEVLVERMKTEAAVPVLVSQQQTMRLFQRIMNADKLAASQSLPDQRMSSAAKAPVLRARFRRSWWAAAAVLLMATVGTWFVIPKTVDTHDVAQKAPDIAPGSTGAILTLADGRQVVLDSLGNGVVAHQNGAAVVLENGQLAYEKNGPANGETVYNTMTTPKGRQFMLVLPDGTRVWLNSASSLRYPTAFSDADRKVTVTGEVYFEVAKDASKPFRVAVNGVAEIEVLGTHFNINAYDNEAAIKTTLLEGAVKVSAALRSAGPDNQSLSVVLKPGQQAQLAQAEGASLSRQQIKVVDDVDVSGVVAWKDGLFNFEDMPLSEVMKQLERWYDIDVIYEGTVPDVEFYGELSRTNTLAEILEAFKDAEIRFRMEGRKLVVLK